MFPGGWLRSPTYARAWTPAPGFAGRWNREMAHALRPAPTRHRTRVTSTTTTRPRRWPSPWPTLDHVWAALPVVIPVVVSLATRMVAIDLAYHVRAGEQVLRGRDPEGDTCTFTSGRSGLAGPAVACSGAAGIGPSRRRVRAIAAAPSWADRADVRPGLPVVPGRRERARETSSLLSLGGFVVCLQALAMRPQLFALLPVRRILWILAARHAHPGRCGPCRCGAVVWANVHGSFLLAPLCWCGLALVEDVIGGLRDGEGWPGLAVG